MLNFQLQEQNFTKNQVNCPYYPHSSLWGLVGFTIDRCIHTVFSLYIQLYIIYIHTSYLTVPCMQLQSCSCCLNSFIACAVPGPIEAELLSIHSTILDTHPLSNKRLFPCSPLVPLYTRSLVFYNTQNLGKTWTSIYNMQCRPIQTKRKWCAMHVSRLKCQRDD